MRFAYQAIDGTGKVVSDTLEAPDQVEAMDALRRQGLYVSDVRPVSSGVALSALAISGGAGCLPPDAPASTADESAVVVGRLITREGVVDLTVRAFADSQGPVPTGSYARLMADVAKGSRYTKGGGSAPKEDCAICCYRMGS